MENHSWSVKKPGMQSRFPHKWDFLEESSQSNLAEYHISIESKNLTVSSAMKHDFFLKKKAFHKTITLNYYSKQ